MTNTHPLPSLPVNYSLLEAFFEFASAFGTVGLSIGITSPTLGNAALLVEMGAMVLGRLEIYRVLIAIHSGIDILHKRGRWR